MKVLIIEDEAPAQRRLQKLILECEPQCEIIGIVDSVSSGMDWFSKNPPPDLIFSDIQLADDLSFKIFSKLNITIPVIFTTAYDEYAINAFKFYSIDYLLKPINAGELKQSIIKYKSIHKKPVANNFEDILKKLTEHRFRERFLVYSGDTLIPVLINEIAYFYSEDGTTMFTTHAGKSFFISESLDQLETELDPKLYFRANRQFIVSISSIIKIHNFGLQKLKLTLKPETDKNLIISKLKATQFKSWLNQ